MKCCLGLWFYWFLFKVWANGLCAVWVCVCKFQKCEIQTMSLTQDSLYQNRISEHGITFRERLIFCHSQQLCECVIRLPAVGIHTWIRSYIRSSFTLAHRRLTGASDKPRKRKLNNLQQWVHYGATIGATHLRNWPFITHKQWQIYAWARWARAPRSFFLWRLITNLKIAEQRKGITTKFTWKRAKKQTSMQIKGAQLFRYCQPHYVCFTELR